MKKIFFFLIVCVGILYSGKIYAYTYEGQGTESSPYLIYTALDLDSVRTHLRDASVHFKMMNDIDLTDYLSAKTNGWVPIGGYASSNPPTFDGVFDGNGHTISGLWIASTSSDIGFFSWISQQTALIENLTVETDDTKGVATDIFAKAYVGILVGTNGNTTFHGGTIRNCSVSGIVSGWRCIGGLVGQTSGSIENCHANNVKVIGTGYNVGGLVGVSSAYGDMTIKNCSVNNASIETAGNAIGGLIGTVTAVTKALVTNVQNCTVSDVTVTSSSNEYVGGLIGSQSGTTNVVSNCSVTRALLSNSDNLGGLIGRNYGPIKHCSAKSIKITSAGKYSGGLIGYLPTPGSIDSCYCEGSIEAIGGLSVGGFVGYASTQNTITNSSSDFKVVSTDSNVGGFIGYTNSSGGSIANCSFHGTVKGNGNVAGFIGKNKWIISNSFAVAEVTARGDSIGGFIGVNNLKESTGNGSTSNCFFSGNVTGVYVVGGFIGGHNYSTTVPAPSPISKCYTLANITSTGTKTGGFIGVSATGAINVENSYCTGKITAASTEALGGFIGDNSGSITFTNAYFNPTASGVTNPVGGSADLQNIKSVNTADMTKQTSYGFDFNTDWNILEGNSYPYFKNQTAPIVSVAATPIQLTGTLQNGMDSIIVCKKMSQVASTYTATGNTLACNFESGSLAEGDTVMVQVSEESLMFSYPVSAIVSNGTGIDQTKAKNNVSVYLSNGILNIKGEEPISKVEIIGLSGSLVYCGRYDVNDVKISLDKYPQGIYLVKAVIGGQSVVQKIVR